MEVCVSDMCHWATCSLHRQKDTGSWRQADWQGDPEHAPSGFMASCCNFYHLEFSEFTLSSLESGFCQNMLSREYFPLIRFALGTNIKCQLSTGNNSYKLHVNSFSLKGQYGIFTVVTFIGRSKAAVVVFPLGFAMTSHTLWVHFKTFLAFWLHLQKTHAYRMKCAPNEYELLKLHYISSLIQRRNRLVLLGWDFQMTKTITGGSATLILDKWTKKKSHVMCQRKVHHESLMVVPLEIQRGSGHIVDLQIRFFLLIFLLG